MKKELKNKKKGLKKYKYYIKWQRIEILLFN